MHLHSQKIGRGAVVAAHSHREGRSPPGRWSWKVKDRNNQFLEVIIFSLSLSLSLSPRIVAYIEEIDSPEERRGGATQRSLNPGKERPSEQERRGRFGLSRGPGAEQRQRRDSAEKTAPSSKNPPPPPLQGLEGGSHRAAGQGLPELATRPGQRAPQTLQYGSK